MLESWPATPEDSLEVRKTIDGIPALAKLAWDERLRIVMCPDESGSKCDRIELISGSGEIIAITSEANSPTRPAMCALASKLRQLDILIEGRLTLHYGAPASSRADTDW